MHWNHLEEEATPWISSKDALLVTDGHPILSQYARKRTKMRTFSSLLNCLGMYFSPSV